MSRVYSIAVLTPLGLRNKELGMSSQLRMQMLEGRTWGVKEDAGEPMGRPRGLSSKILGLGVALVGVLILAVALIMGLEFPKYVHRQLSTRQCIMSDQHQDFTKWVTGSWWKKVVKLYFWEIQNSPQFLYEGQTPVLVERGPYVYEVTEFKRDVAFDFDHVTFVTSRRYQFLQTETTQECEALGRQCSQDDQITVVNSDYLREVTRAGGELPLLLTWTPNTVLSFLQTQSIVLNQTGSWSPSLQALGCIDSACIQQWSSSITNATAVDLGEWLRHNDSEAKAAVLRHRGDTSFSHKDLSDLFHSLTNETLWGREEFITSQSLFQDSSQVGSSEGGLVAALYHSSTLAPDVSWKAIIQFVCGGSDPCLGLDFSISDNATISAYVDILREFVLHHLAGHVQDSVFRGGNHDLVTTRPQSELALGWERPTARGGRAQAPGALDSLWESGQQDANVSWRLATCLAGRNNNNNMLVTRFQGLDSAPSSLLKPGATTVSLQSHTNFLPACASFRTCASCGTPPSHANVFVPELWRAVNFTDLQASDYGGTQLYRLHMHNGTLSDDAAYDVSRGTQNVTGVVGVMAWRSYPSLPGPANISQTPADSRRSYIDVEPSSGRVWRRETQLQLNLGIRTQDVEGPRLQPLQLSWLHQPLPVWWSARLNALTVEEMDTFHYKVSRLLAVSCGGLCALSVVALVILVVSVVVCASPGKANRVAPAVEEISMATHH